MKIAPKLVESYIKSPDREHRAVLLYGPDAGLVRERARRIANSFIAGSSDPFALVEISNSRLMEDGVLLADELSAISMMAPKRVIMLRDAGEKLTGIIQDASTAFNDSVLLVVCADELSTRSSLRAWFEKETNAGAVACYRDDVRDVQDIIRKTFETAGVRISRDTLEYLSGQLGNDRYVTYQELEKLITYAGDTKSLELKDAEALVDYNKETSFDDVVNAVADRSLAQLDKTLNHLLREGTQPVAYLRALQRYFNRLYFIRGQMAKENNGGQSADQVIAALRPPVFFKQVPILTRHVQSWTIPQLTKALKLLVSAELACKTSDLPIIPASSRYLLQITQVR